MAEKKKSGMNQVFISHSRSDLDLVTFIRNSAAHAHSTADDWQRLVVEFKTVKENNLIILNREAHVGKLQLIEDAPESNWEFRLIKIAAFILPETTREEWLGDLKEALYELRAEGYPRWIRTLIAAGRICLLAIALFRITVRDLVSPTKKERL
jgi:hypothetical protein